MHFDPAKGFEISNCFKSRQVWGICGDIFSVGVEVWVGCVEMAKEFGHNLSCGAIFCFEHKAGEVEEGALEEHPAVAAIVHMDFKTTEPFGFGERFGLVSPGLGYITLIQ